MERICIHGCGHPDPDCVVYLQNKWPQGVWGVHGCDGCCAVNDVHRELYDEWDSDAGD